MTPEEWYVAANDGDYYLAPGNYDEFKPVDRYVFNRVYMEGSIFSGWSSRDDACAVAAAQPHDHEVVVSRDDLLVLIAMRRAKKAMEDT